MGTAEIELSRLSFGMVLCAYCGQEATMRIVSNPEQVCFDHALEYWTGLLDYWRETSVTCVKEDLRACAIAAAGPSPADHEHFSIRLAS